jgi:DNA-binding CsgD family transcriptional regulator
LLADLRALMEETHIQSARLRSTWGKPSEASAALSLMTRLQAYYGMTPRESEVAALLAEGLSNNAVAKRLGISPHTARHHTQHVLGKLGVHSRAEAGARLRR